MVFSVDGMTVKRVHFNPLPETSWRSMDQAAVDKKVKKK
jgi:hypothetical protein